METRSRYAIYYLVAAIALFIGWTLIQGYIWKAPEKPKPARTADVAGLLGGGAVATTGADPEADVLLQSALAREKEQEAKAREIAQNEAEKAPKKATEPDKLLAMGWGEKPFHLRVLLNTRGGSIQQVVVPYFQQADREGLAVVNPDGSPRPLHLIPGVDVPRTPKMRDQRDVRVPDLEPGTVDPEFKQLAHPSYVMYHYEKE